VSYAQCPICALRFRYQSELDSHAHEAHCEPAEVHLSPHVEHERWHPQASDRAAFVRPRA
jgi:hypothetical protein